MKQDLSTGCLVTVEQQELDRRIQAIRDLMEETESQLFLAAAPIKGGWGKWLTGTDGPGRPCEGGILIAKSGAVMLVNGGALVPRGAFGTHNDAMAPGCRGDGFSGYESCEGFSADIMEQMVNACGYEEIRRIAIVNMDDLRADLRNYLKKNLQGAKLLDVTVKAEALRAQKSPAELDIIQANARMMDKVFAGAGIYMNPRRYERDIVTDLRYAAYRLGCGGVDHQICAPVELTSGRDGEIWEKGGLRFPGRLVEFGDRINVKMYALGNDGYYAGMARSFVLGEPSEETRHLWEIAAAAQDKAAELLRPGASVEETAGTINEYLKQQGCAEDNHTMIHSIGETIYENPMVFGEASLQVKENMVFYIGPVADNGKSEPVGCGDLYVVGKEKTRRINAFPRNIIRLY